MAAAATAAATAAAVFVLLAAATAAAFFFLLHVLGYFMRRKLVPDAKNESDKGVETGSWFSPIQSFIIMFPMNHCNKVEAVEGMPIVRHTIIQWDNSTSDNRG